MSVSRRSGFVTWGTAFPNVTARRTPPRLLTAATARGWETARKPGLGRLESAPLIARYTGGPVYDGAAR